MDNPKGQIVTRMNLLTGLEEGWSGLRNEIQKSVSQDPGSRNLRSPALDLCDELKGQIRAIINTVPETIVDSSELSNLCTQIQVAVMQACDKIESWKPCSGRTPRGHTKSSDVGTYTYLKRLFRKAYKKARTAFVESHGLVDEEADLALETIAVSATPTLPLESEVRD